ncbi:MAG: bifunctional (p)ppGpp synthetase/guanosine-3',5'-bis(diphosphate) 3'-pyrophosphohydrolase [Acidobacteria bacterium]|nr:bifunctional (p)ppGpp synthetase/guanosine-3',5'-bis(diphosphate) 3'-pyrophosphohydrolase [Acidobacteriota bacterium]
MANLPGQFRQAISTNLLTLTKFRELLNKVQSYRPNDDLEPLRRAYQTAAQHHGSQRRHSGELYLVHPVAVAHILADLRMDLPTLQTALLHDIVEDTQVTIDEVRQQFGAEVARLVEGVTKIGKFDFASREERQAHNLRKMLLAMVDDVRVIFVKMADRLHNMRTLKFVPEDKQQRIAQETLDVYAPLAHRMGMGKVRGELEDLAFSFLDPIAYEEIRKQLEGKRRTGEEFLKEIAGVIEKKLGELGIAGLVEWRIKRPYSIFQKLKQQNSSMDQVYDLLAVRIICDNLQTCYASLGVIHGMWQPVPGRIKDFIAMPRPNLYQSLHTTLIGKNGQPFEVQIRTKEMHHTAELGIAAHWKYKEGEGPISIADEKNMAWLRHLVEWQQDLSDPGEFMSSLRIDLYPEEVYSFTPRGKVMVLPRGSSPVDFAYSVHTQVGDTCVGAKVNGKMVSLRYRLRNGDIVEILTQKESQPSRDWLGFTASTKARNRIKHFIHAAEREGSIELGLKLIEKECRRYDISWKSVPEADLLKAAQTSGCPKVDDLYSAVGYGRVPAQVVLARLFPDKTPPQEQPAKKSLARTVQHALGIGRDEAIQVKGLGDVLVYRAQCCDPIRGEEIVGYITRGKGVAVHSRKCPNVQNLLYESGRKIEVEWASSAEDAFPVTLTILTQDRPGLIKELTAALTEKTNIRNIETRVGDAGDAHIDLTLDIVDTKQLERLIVAMRKVPGVRGVERIYKA